ncbi:YezD family protein [Niallia sp. 01092]
MGEANQLEKVRDQLEQILNKMKFGSVTLVVQDGKVIQIEKNEKIRLGK